VKSGFVGHFEAVDLESQLKTPARCSNKRKQKIKKTQNDKQTQRKRHKKNKEEG